MKRSKQSFTCYVILISLALAVTTTLAIPHAFGVEPFCAAGSNPNPSVIFCDDFEDGAALVRPGRYFEHDSNSGEFVIVNGVGLNGSHGMRALWQPGEVDAGSLKLAFGRNPGGGMNTGIRVAEDFREIYYRLYLKMQTGWSGDPGKLSRATSIVASNWSQAMIAHLWGDGSNHLLIDPASCVGTTNVLRCSGYNDFGNLAWLGSQSGSTPIFDTAHSNEWFCIEHHVKLNDPGQSNGVEEFWINDRLEARRANLNFVGSYVGYAINTIFFENYWNNGSPSRQERYIDNIVVSKDRIGCVSTDGTSPSAPNNPRVQ
jgi:hypothetical protein